MIFFRYEFESNLERKKNIYNGVQKKDTLKKTLRKKDPL